MGKCLVARSQKFSHTWATLYLIYIWSNQNLSGVCELYFHRIGLEVYSALFVYSLKDSSLLYTITVDGSFLKKAVDELLKNHEVHRVPFMTGVTDDEGGWLLPRVSVKYSVFHYLCVSLTTLLIATTLFSVSFPSKLDRGSGSGDFFQHPVLILPWRKLTTLIPFLFDILCFSENVSFCLSQAQRRSHQRLDNRGIYWNWWRPRTKQKRIHWAHRGRFF